MISRKVYTMLFLSALILSIMVPGTPCCRELNASTKYFSLLKNETAYWYRLKNYRHVLDIIYEELDGHPTIAKEIIQYVKDDPNIHNYAISNGPLTVILDNSLKWKTDVSLNENTVFSIPGLSHKKISLPPGNHELTFFCNSVNYLEETTLPIISPGKKNSYLIYNIGKLNSYSLRNFDKSKSNRLKSDPTVGWPKLIRNPQTLWISDTELFPPLNPKRPLRPGEERNTRRFYRSIVRIHQKKQSVRSLPLN